MKDGFHIELTNRQAIVPIDRQQLVEAVQLVLRDHGMASASISLAVVDDPTIHELNRRYLSHDYPTDVLSFVFEQSASHLEGEVIVSAETAHRLSSRCDWPAAHELLLYVVHGALHLVGHCDQSPEGAREMWQAQLGYLSQMGIPVERMGNSPHDACEASSAPVQQGELTK